MDKILPKGIEYYEKEIELLSIIFKKICKIKESKNIKRNHETLNSIEMQMDLVFKS